MHLKEGIRVCTYVQSPAKVLIRHMCEKVRHFYFYKTYHTIIVHKLRKSDSVARVPLQIKQYLTN